MVDYSKVICVSGIPVGVLLAGQYVPSASVDAVQRHVEGIATGHNREIELLDGTVKAELLARLAVAPRPPANFGERFAREAGHIQAVAEAYHRSQKAEVEWKFLDDLRNMRRYRDQANLGTIGDEAQQLLQDVRSYCNCRYIVLFTNVNEQDTVLSPLAQVGFGEEPSSHGGGTAPLQLDKGRLGCYWRARVAHIYPAGRIRDEPWCTWRACRAVGRCVVCSGDDFGRYVSGDYAVRAVR
jgi:hypothetical protein